MFIPFFDLRTPLERVVLALQVRLDRWSYGEYFERDLGETLSWRGRCFSVVFDLGNALARRRYLGWGGGAWRGHGDLLAYQRGTPQFNPFIDDIPF